MFLSFAEEKQMCDTGHTRLPGVTCFVFVFGLDSNFLSFVEEKQMNVINQTSGWHMAL